MPVTAQPAFTTYPAFAGYITLGEYMAAPTALDITQLKANGTEADQQRTMTTLILEASGIVESICNQPLVSQQIVEAGRVRVSRDGEIGITTHCFPVLEVRDFQVGQLGSPLTQMPDLSHIWIEDQGFSVLPGGLIGVGQLGGGFGYGSGRLTARWSYVNGFPVTRLALGTYTAGQTTITVTDATGIYGAASPSPSSLLPQASQLHIADPANGTNEFVTVQSVAGNVLTLTAPLAFGHIAGATPDQFVGVSALPEIVRKATVLLVNSLIQSRGDGAIIAPSIAQGGYNARMASPRARDADDENRALAKEWLIDFTVVV